MSLVLVEDRNRVRTLTLNRPDKLNACSEELLDALGDELVKAAADDTVATVLLTGAGRAFCVGADLMEMAQRNAACPSAGTGSWASAGRWPTCRSP